MFEQFKQLKELTSLLGNADQMRLKAEKVQNELARTEVTGEAGAGAVKVVVTGRSEMVRVEVDDSALATLGADEAARQKALCELIVAASNEAVGKAQEMMREKLSEALGGLQLPGGMDGII